MKMIKTFSYPRAALIGNPSDGYFGKTIAFVFNNFKAEACLSSSKRLELVPGKQDRLVFSGMKELSDNIDHSGYYGGIRLLKATIKQFFDYCTENNIPLEEKNFTLSYNSNLPNRLGLAGSSAIITACMKALLQYYQVEIANPVLANLILSVETEALGIAAGLQDRVAQVYETPVYMDFAKALMSKRGYGEYIAMDPTLFPNLYLAFRTASSEGSEVVHNNFKERYKLGEPEVLAAIDRWSQLTDIVRQKLENGDKKIAAELNENFDIRRKIMNISRENIDMVETARSTGASAKFTGSGGAIIGTYESENMYGVLCDRLGKKGIEVIKPEMVG